MSWNQAEVKWKQIAGALRKLWGILADDDLAVARGRRDILAGRLQERYGVAGEEARQQADRFCEWFRVQMTPGAHGLKADPRE